MAWPNDQSPNIRGAELCPRVKRAFELNSPTRALLYRYKPTATTALANLHPRVSEAFGSNPGLAIEVLDNPFPVLLNTVIYPGTDTGATVTGWEDQGGSTANYTEVNDFAGDEYHRNDSALAQGAALKHKMRGSAAAWTSASRVTKVALEALVQLRADGTFGTTGNAARVRLQGIVDIGGTEYIDPGGVWVDRGGWKVVTVATWTTSPATDLPWVTTSLDDLWSSTDEFGFQVTGGKIAAEGFRVAGYRLRVYYCAENRKGFYYAAGSVEEGWGERAVSSAGALVANAFTYVLVYALNGSSSEFLETSLLGDPDAAYTLDPAQTGDHRACWEVVLHNQGGTVARVVPSAGVELLPLLIDNGSIVDGSNGAADIVYYELAEKIGGVDFDGASGSYLSCADSAGLSITGDLDLQCWVAPDDWDPASAETLIGKWTTTADQRSYMLQIIDDGASNPILRLSWSTDGTAGGVLTRDSGTVSGVVDGQTTGVRATIDVDDGAGNRVITFYTASSPVTVPDEAVTWTQVSSHTVAGTTSIFDSTAVLEVAGNTLGTANRLNGSVYRARVVAGLTDLDVRAEPVLYADAAFPATLEATLSDTSIPDLQANTWTLNGGSTFARYAVGQQRTTAAQTDYLAVRLAVMWAGGTQPDSALTIEVRTGAAAASGGGTLVASAYVSPEDVPSPVGARLDVTFSDNAAVTLAATTQHYVRVSSTASPTAAWAVAVLDSRSDDLGLGTTGPMLAEVEGATDGGQTDGFVDPVGQILDRFDLPCALVVEVTGPSGVTGDVSAAA